MKLKDLAIEHSYYGHTGNNTEEYENWAEFITEWGGEDDIDRNMIYRWDVTEYKGKFSLTVHYILQGRGEIRPCIINNITEDDAPAIVRHLMPHLVYIKKLWTPLS